MQKCNKIKFFLILAFLLFTIAPSPPSKAELGLILGETAGADVSYFPHGLEKFTDEAAVAKLMCFEAKGSGGEVVAVLEALNEELPAVYESLQYYNIVPEIVDYSQKAFELRSKLEDICKVQSVKEQNEKIKNFEESAAMLDMALKNELGQKIRGIAEPVLKNKSEEIRTALDIKIKNESIGEVNIAEDKLAEQYQAEISALKVRLEGEIKLEAEKKLQELFDAGKLGENPEQAALEAEGEKIKAQLIARDKNKYEKELKAKYDRQAAAEGDNILREYVASIGPEALHYGKTKALLEGFEKTVADAKEKKYRQEWLQYAEESQKMKKEIYGRILSAQIEAAEKILEENKDAIASAKNSGKLSRYESKTIAELTDNLRTAREKLIDSLDDNKTDQLNRGFDGFKKAWDQANRVLEVAKINSKEDMLAKIDQDLSAMGAGSKLEEARKHFEATMTAYVKKNDLCELNSYLKDPKRRDRASACAACRSLEALKKRAEFSQRAVTMVERAIEVLNDYEQLKKKSDLEMDEIIEFKEELEQYLGAVKSLNEQYQPLFKAYEANFQENQNICFSLI